MRVLILSLTFLVGLLNAPSACSQENTPRRDATKPTPGDVFGALLGESIPDRLTQMTNRVLDGYLTYLAKPETTKKLATFQRNYYDALIEQGFTKEQSFELVLRFGNPLADLSHSKE